MQLQACRASCTSVAATIAQSQDIASEMPLLLGTVHVPGSGVDEHHAYLKVVLDVSSRCSQCLWSLMALAADRGAEGDTSQKSKRAGSLVQAGQAEGRPGPSCRDTGRQCCNCRAAGMAGTTNLMLHNASVSIAFVSQIVFFCHSLC